MKDLQSGLDAWRYITSSDSRRSSVETYLPLILSASGALGVLPFLVLRCIQQEWIAAAVDAAIVIGFTTLGWYVFRTRRVRMASIALSILCMGGVIATVYLVGPHQIYWVYPALMAVFYLARPREAIGIALLTIVVLVPKLMESTDTHATMTVLITSTVMGAFGFAFSLITNWQRAQLVQMATKDPLTGAGNRRGLKDKLEEIVNSYRRNAAAASMLMIDLDHFKKVNDVYGHAAGDRILQRITEIINLRIRVTDSLYRIGGEEFVVVLEGQGIERAAHLAEQLRTLVEANELVPDHSVTISLGVAELRAEEAAQDWLIRADKALYCAKRAGRNSTNISD